MLNQSVRKIINVDSANLVPLYTFKQEDDAVLLLSLFRNSVPLDITGQTVTLGIKRPNGTLVNLETLEGDNPFIIDSNNLDIKLKNSVLAIPGLLECDLELVDVNGKMTTASFYITVNRKVVGDTNIQATNEISILNKIKLEEEARETNETNRKESEIARVSAEELREQQETIRDRNETTREESETIRSDQESIRKNNEITREEQESSRALNESQRTENENARALKEEERVNSENTRNSNEETRKYNEALRIEAETVRDSQEDMRESNEDIRNSNETNRQNKEQERASAEETRKTNELARQGAYKEIEGARKDFNGVVRDNLNERLAYDMGYVNDRFNKASLLEYESKYISAIKSYDGITRDLKVKGRTLQNLCVNGGDISPVTQYLYKKELKNIKNSTNYTICFKLSNVVKGSLSIPFSISIENTPQAPLKNVPFENGIYKLLVTTKDSTSLNVASSVYVNFWTQYANVGQSYQISEIVVLEGDYTNENIPYFEGIKSVGEEGKIDVVSCRKNLFDKNRIELNKQINGLGEVVNVSVPNNNAVFKGVKLKPNTAYKFEVTKVGNEALQYNGTKAFIYSNGSLIRSFWLATVVQQGNNFVTAPYEDYIKLSYNITSGANTTVESILTTRIEESISAPYEPYKETRIPITLTTPLRGLTSDLYDELDLENSKVIRRIGKIILNGSEDWRNYNTFAITQGFNLAINGAKGGPNYSKSICNKFNALGTVSDDKEGFSHGDVSNNLYIRINISKLATQDLAGFKLWLSQNPVTFYYELATPVEEPIVLPNNLRTYDNVTNIFTESSLIEPTIYSKIPSNVQAVVSSLREDNEYLNNEVSSLSLENEELKEGHKVQSIQIEDSETAINFLLMESMSNISVMKIQSNEMEVRSMESYFAKQIYKGALEYDAVIAKYPQYKEGIDKLLREYVENDGIIYSNNGK